MRILVTGSSGHLGEALMRMLRDHGVPAIGADLVAGPFTTHVGDLVDEDFVAHCTADCEAIVHAATLHKPHVATHPARAFLDTNLTATLNLLERAVAGRCRAFVFTSTTSTFGRALVPPPGAPAAWITEDVRPVAKNIYGVTKVAAEDLCELFHRRHALPCVVLRTSRFFPEADDDPGVRARFADLNTKVNELLHRRVDIEDAARAHLCALERAPAIGFARLIVSATTPFAPEHVARLREAPGEVLRELIGYEHEYSRRGWRAPERIDRVYDNRRARELLGWSPRHTFAHAIERLAADAWPFSQLMCDVGAKGYHPGMTFGDAPFPVRPETADDQPKS